jgi:hypothetical protein
MNQALLVWIQELMGQLEAERQEKAGKYAR